MLRGACLAVLLALPACGTPPPVREQPRPPPRSAPDATAPDPCEPVNGRPPAPVAGVYTGVLGAARCQPEVLAIMQGLTRSLGVDCDHCHDETDYSAATENKRIANWMATELMPRLALRSGKRVGCADCHADDGHGKAKILGAPRSRQRAVEWMTTALVERFDAAVGGPLYCRTCHLGQLGAPAFQGHVILTEHLPPAPPAASAAPVPESSPSATAAPDAGL